MTYILTPDQKEWARQRYGAEPGLQLVTLYGEEMTDVVRLARNTEDIVSRGETFIKSWFDVVPPGDTDDQPQASLVLSNVDRRLGLAFQEVAGSKIFASLELVRPSEPDVVVEAARRLQARLVQIDRNTVTLTLSAVRLDRETYGWIRVSPALFIGLWAYGNL